MPLPPQILLRYDIMTDEFTLPEELADRIRTHADRHPDATAAGVIGTFDALDPSDLSAVRELLDGEDVEPITEPDGNTHRVSSKNLSVEKSRNTNTADGDGVGEPEDGHGSLDTAINESSDESKQSPEDADAGEPAENPPLEGGFSSSTPWFDAEVSAPRSGIYPPALDDREKWMGAAGKDGKQAFAPWGDRDHPEAEPEKDARWKWGLEENHADGATVDEWEEKDPRIGGRAFIQLESDPFAFVDGDDVRCPETKEVHPVFRALLEHLGATYADISTSGSGAHATYYAPDGLPIDGNGQATFEIDTEPWGANDTAPTVEIYANKHLSITHGDHIPGSPLEVREWDDAALRAILEAHGFDDKPAIEHDTDRDRPDLEEYEPDAEAGEHADDVKDVLYAIDRLDPRDLPLRTRQVDTDATGWEKWDPSSYRTSSGNDSLHRPPGESVFHDHKHNEAFGILSLFAAERGILSKPWDRWGDRWWDAVDAARDAGAPIPEYDPAPNPEDADPVAILPNTPVNRAERFGGLSPDRRDTEESDPIQDRRDRVTDAIGDVYQYGDRTLLEALPTLGKTYGAVKAAADTGVPTAILTTRGRKEQYEEIAELCEKFGLSYAKLPAFTHDCETANGDHGEEWADRVQGWYRSGATPKQIHKYAEDALDRPLPCQAGERTCTYAAKWGALEKATDTEGPVDVLIGHYTHAHKRKVTAGRAVAFDEFPGGAYETTLAGERELAGAVSTYLDRTPQVPFDDYTDLLENRDDDTRRSDGLTFLLEDLDPDPKEAFDGRGGHAYAPLVVFTLLASDDLGNGWEAAPFPDDDPRIGAFNRERNRVHIRTPPDLDLARSVVALDGTPTPELWELALDERLNHRRVLSDAERKEYLDDILGLDIVPTTDAIKPYNSSQHVNTKQDLALLEAIADKHGTTPGVISTQTAFDTYRADGALEFDPEDGTVTEGPADRVKWYGNVLGSNDFKHTRVGAVIGSQHYGDDFIQKWGAFAGRAVERNSDKGADLSYGSFGDRVLTHMREHETLQAAMRFGRDGNGATVYVHSDTLPEWVPTADEGRVINCWSDGMKDVLDAAADLEEFRTAGIADHPAVDLSQRQVRDHLNTLAERGYLDREHEGRGFVWRDDGLHRVNDHGDVDLDTVDLDDLPESEVAEVTRSSIYTWEFRKTGADSESDPVDAGVNGGENRSAIATGGSDPPDAAD